MDRERIDRAHKEALEARSKSLEYIDKLLHEFPEDEKLQVAKINGYFFMGALIPTQNKDEWIRWLDEGIAMAGIFLKKHPAHAAILETATCMRLHRCNSLLSYEPSKYAEEVLPELLEVIEINRMLLKQDCSHSTLFTYACKGFWSRVLAFMELGNYSESLLELERLVEFYQDYDDILRKDWTALDNLFNGYFLACEKLVLDGRYSEAIHIATRWREVATSQNVTDCITVHGHRYPGSEFAVAFPIYYQWLARSKHSPESKEYADATIDLRDAIGRCKSRSPKDLEVLVEAVMKGWPDLEQSTNPKIDSIETALPR